MAEAERERAKRKETEGRRGKRKRVVHTVVRT
jgi:hypothetical protein